MASYQDSVILKFDSPDTGNAAVGRSIAVKQLGLLSNIFSDAELTIPKSNPFLTDQDGFYQFYCADGLYEIEIGNPVERTIQTPIGSISDIKPGVTVLSNSKPNNTFLERNNQVVNTDDYVIGGTPGYPLIFEPTSYSAGPEYSNGLIIDTEGSALRKETFIDDNNVSYALIRGGSFLYSEDNGSTEFEASTSNTINLNAIATDSINYIVGVASSGRIEIFDYKTKSSIGNQTVGSNVFRFVEYNKADDLWYAINWDGRLYSTLNPFSSWVDLGIIPGSFGTGNNYTKTNNGYLCQDVNGNIYFIDNLVTGTLSLVVSSGSSDFIFKSTMSKNSDNGILIGIGSSGREVYKTINGGQSFSSVSFTGLPIETLVDGVNIEGDVYVVVSVSNNFYYTLDAGLTFTEVLSNTSSNGAIYKTSNNEVINVLDNIDLRSIAIPGVPALTKFRVTQLLSPNSTDKYYVKAK